MFSPFHNLFLSWKKVSDNLKNTVRWLSNYEEILLKSLEVGSQFTTVNKMTFC